MNKINAVCTKMLPPIWGMSQKGPDRVRIITGDAKGISLKVPRSGTRPSSDQLREALFGILHNLLDCEGLAVLDLYAGTGALGLEALSRGAGSVTLVEKSAKAAAILKTNAATVSAAVTRARSGTEGHDGGSLSRVVTSASLQFTRETTQRYDLVFIDPPYELVEKELSALLELLPPLLHPEAIVVAELSSRSALPTWPPQLDLLDNRKYGDTRLLIFEHSGDTGVSHPA